MAMLTVLGSSSIKHVTHIRAQVLLLGHPVARNELLGVCSLLCRCNWCRCNWNTVSALCFIPGLFCLCNFNGVSVIS